MEFERRDVLVGAVVLGVGLILLAVLWRINRERLTAQTYRLEIHLANIAGIDKGDEVVYRGYRAGVVDRVAIAYEPQFKFIVRLAIKTELRLRQGTTVTVRDKGFAGAKYLELVAPPDGQGVHMLADGAVLPVVPDLALMAKANAVLADVQRVVRDFQKSSATGDVVRTLADAKAAAANANLLLGNLNALIGENRGALNESVRHAGNVLARTDSLLAQRDAALSQTLENLNQSMSHLPAILINVEELTAEVKRRPWRLLRKGEAEDPPPLDHKHPAPTEPRGQTP